MSAAVSGRETTRAMSGFVDQSNNNEGRRRRGGKGRERETETDVPASPRASTGTTCIGDRCPCAEKMPKSVLFRRKTTKNRFFGAFSDFELGLPVFDLALTLTPARRKATGWRVIRVSGGVGGGVRVVKRQNRRGLDLKEGRKLLVHSDGPRTGRRGGGTPSALTSAARAGCRLELPSPRKKQGTPPE